MKLLFEEITGKVSLDIQYATATGFPARNEDVLLTATADISVSRRDSETVLLKGDPGWTAPGCL